jgi:hypothetical protein
MLRIPHYLDNRLTDGGKVTSPTHRPRSTSQKHYYFSASGTHFCWRLSEHQGPVRPEISISTGVANFPGKIGQGVYLTSQLHLVAKLRMRGAISPFSIRLHSQILIKHRSFFISAVQSNINGKIFFCFFQHNP